MARADSERELLRAIASSFPQSADRLRGQMEALASLAGIQNDRLRENTEAVTQNTTSRSAGASVANTGRSILSALGGGLFFSPLISGLARLFRGSRGPETELLPPAPRPRPFNLEAGLFSGVGPAAFDWDQYGRPREAAAQRPDLSAITAPQQAGGPFRGDPGTYDLGRAQPAAPANVTVQIQALDSRSILDRADDIARALREAMLHSHSVNDVIHEA